jgi:hypothetical protein
VKERNSLISDLSLKISSIQAVLNQQETTIKDLVSEKSNRSHCRNSEPVEDCEKLAKVIIEKVMTNPEMDQYFLKEPKREGQARPECEPTQRNLVFSQDKSGKKPEASKTRVPSQKGLGIPRDPASYSRNEELRSKNSVSKLVNGLQEQGRKFGSRNLSNSRENKENIEPRQRGSRPPQSHKKGEAKRDGSGEAFKPRAKCSEVLTALSQQARNNQIRSPFNASYYSMYSNGKGHCAQQGSYGQKWEEGIENSRRSSREKREGETEGKRKEKEPEEKEVYGFPQFFK